MTITGTRLGIACSLCLAALAASTWTALAQERRGPDCTAAEAAPQPGFIVGIHQPTPACIRIRLR